MAPAHFLARFMAWLFDGLITGIFAVVLALATASLVGIILSLDPGIFNMLALIVGVVTAALLLLLNFLYYGYFWSTSGASLGMKAFDITVVRRKPGARISFWRAGFRGTIGYWISAIPLYLGYIWAGFDGNKESWHDKIFDTHVVKVPWEEQPLREKYPIYKKTRSAEK